MVPDLLYIWTHAFLKMTQSTMRFVMEQQFQCQKGDKVYMRAFSNVYFTTKYTFGVSTCLMLTKLVTENANILRYQEQL